MKQEQQEQHKTGNDYRYPGSRPFNDTGLDRSLFFGRDEEKQRLFHHILVEKLFVLYSKSGMGKTSLLNAGLMQMLRDRDFLPMSIRFNNPETNPTDTVYKGIEAAVEQRNRQVDDKDKIDYEKWESDSLWQFFKTAAFWIYGDVPLTPILIFDQFEEFFTLHKQEEREAFIAQLADLLRGRVPRTLRNTFKSKSYEQFPYSSTAPKVKIVISIREDYLGCLDEMSKTIPGILNKSFRLLPLTCRKAKDAIIKPAQLSGDEYKHIRSKGFTYTDKTIEEMLDFLCERKEMGKTIKTKEVEPFQLQLLCRHIEVKVRQKAGQSPGVYMVKPGDLGGRTGMKNVLQGFYENRLKVLSTPWKRRKVRKLCEKGLIFNERRSIMDEGPIIKKYRVSKELLAQLVDNRLLRSEPRIGSIFYELSHDTFVEPILKSRRRRKKFHAWIGVLILAVILTIIVVTNFPGKLKKGFDTVFNNQYVKALELKHQGNYRDAIEAYSNIPRGKKESFPLYLEIGKLYEDLNDPDNAKKIYEEAIKNGIEHAIIFYRLGRIYADHDGNPEKAIENLKKAISIGPKQAEFHIALGDIYRKMEEFGKAVEEYDKAKRLNDKNADVWKSLAISYINREKPDPDKAIKEYEKAIKRINADDAHIYIDIGRAMKKKGIDDKLERLYQIAFEVTSNKAAYYEELGDNFNELKNYDMAIESYNKALEISKENADIYKKLAIVYIRQGKPDEAIGEYVTAVKKNKKFANIYMDIALEMKQEEMDDELETLYRKASEVETDDAEYYVRLGYEFNVLTQYNRAIETFKKAIEIDPQNAYAWRQQGVANRWLEDYKEAISCYNKAIEYGLTNVRTYNMLGVAYGRTGNYNEAINNYEEALDINPNYMAARVNLAEVTLAAGKFKQAYNMAQKILEKKGISTVQELTLRFISCVSLIFQDKQDKRSEANKEFDGLFEAYRTLPGYRPGAYGVSRKFIGESKQLKKDERNLLLELITILESPKTKGEKKLKVLEPKIKKILKSESTLVP